MDNVETIKRRYWTDYWLLGPTQAGMHLAVALDLIIDVPDVTTLDIYMSCGIQPSRFRLPKEKEWTR